MCMGVLVLLPDVHTAERKTSKFDFPICMQRLSRFHGKACRHGAGPISICLFAQYRTGSFRPSFSRPKKI